jgi:2-iminoacetate synthase ThiH
MKNYRRLWKYGILHRIKTGITVGIMPTFRCNYKCTYCTTRFNGNAPQAQEVKLEDWIYILDNFPVKLKEVVFSGGEPTLVPYCALLINHLIGKRIQVAIFTNLSNNVLMDVPPSPYFRIGATYHKQANIKAFVERYKVFKKAGYQITADEIGNPLLQDYGIKSIPKEEITPDQVDEMKLNFKMLRIGPDLKISLNCYDAYYKP